MSESVGLCNTWQMPCARCLTQSLQASSCPLGPPLCMPIPWPSGYAHLNSSVFPAPLPPCPTCQCGSNTCSTDSQPAVALCAPGARMPGRPGGRGKGRPGSEGSWGAGRPLLPASLLLAPQPARGLMVTLQLHSPTVDSGAPAMIAHAGMHQGDAKGAQAGLRASLICHDNPSIFLVLCSLLSCDTSPK